MTYSASKLFKRVLGELIIIVYAFIVLVPLSLVVLGAFKNAREAAVLNLSLPTVWVFSNITSLVGDINFHRSLLNSTIFVIFGVTLCILFSSMSAYYLSRNRSRLSTFIYYLFISGILIPPFIIPLMRLLGQMHLLDTYPGIISVYVCGNIPIAIFLLTGFIKGIPRALEECAYIDGAKPVRAFFQILFPLLTPVVVTLVVWLSLNMWNDFQGALYFLKSKSILPITMWVYRNVTMYQIYWDRIFPVVFLSLIPLMIIYVLAQRYMVSGLVAGSIRTIRTMVVPGDHPGDTQGPPHLAPLRFSALDAAYLGLSAFGAGSACLVVVTASRSPSAAQLIFLVSAACLCVLFAAAEALARKPGTYGLWAAIHAACCLLAAALAPAGSIVPTALAVPFTFGICLYNRWSVALAAAGAVTVLVAAILWRVAAGAAGGLAGVIQYVVLAACTAAAGTLLVHYREGRRDARAETRRLNAMAERLAMANLGYQEYASRVEEASIDLERKRITRDIHDIVGYTLTNTITMMEAITDLMRTNPLGVESLVDAARENAEDGLARVREALHLLRQSEVPRLTGLPAVDRLISVYQRATEVKVETAFTDVPWSFPPALDAALYRVIQEGLINAFRHGRATRVRIFLQRLGDRTVLRISDNGVGAASFHEGIGLTGMRERLAALDGTLEALPLPFGFELKVTVPADGKGTAP